MFRKCLKRSASEICEFRNPSKSGSLDFEKRRTRISQSEGRDKIHFASLPTSEIRAEGKRSNDPASTMKANQMVEIRSQHQGKKTTQRLMGKLESTSDNADCPSSPIGRLKVKSGPV